jgi:hypothetical protein
MIHFHPGKASTKAVREARKRYDQEKAKERIVL